MSYVALCCPLLRYCKLCCAMKVKNDDRSKLGRRSLKKLATKPHIGSAANLLGSYLLVSEIMSVK